LAIKVNPFQQLQQQQALQASRNVTPGQQASGGASASAGTQLGVKPPSFGMQTLSAKQPQGGDELSKFQGQIQNQKVNPNLNAPAIPHTSTRDFGLA
jgi:hypothetical protein